MEITGVWLQGRQNEVAVLVEIDGNWIEVISEYMPTHGNDGDIWPISHIVEPSGIEAAKEQSEVNRSR